MSEPSLPDLTHYDAVLIDLDGTVYRENFKGAEILPGARELIAALNDRRQPYACLTNSGSSPAGLAKRLASMGATVDEEHIWSCASSSADFCLHRFGPLPRIYSLASEGFHEILEGKVAWVENPTDACDAIVVSNPSNPRASQQRAWEALQILRRKSTALVGMCADRVFPSHRGLEFGSGALTEMLAYASGITPQYCGKPEPVFFQELCQKLQVAPDRCILLGDNLDSDIAGAKKVGMASALLLTGITDRPTAAAAPHDRHPDFILDSLAQLI